MWVVGTSRAESPPPAGVDGQVPDAVDEDEPVIEYVTASAIPRSRARAATNGSAPETDVQPFVADPGETCNHWLRIEEEHPSALMGWHHSQPGNSRTGGKAMAARIDQMTSFTYTTYIHATPERVWQGLTDPAVTRRYWRHQRAGEKTFRSDWKTSATIGFEADYTSVASAKLLRKLAHRRIRWQPAAGLIMQQRMIKDPEELQLIAGAVSWGRRVPRSAAKPPPRSSGVGSRGNVGVCRAASGSRWHGVRDHRRGGKTGGSATGRASRRKPYPGVDSWWWIPVLYCGATVPT